MNLRLMVRSGWYVAGVAGITATIAAGILAPRPAPAQGTGLYLTGRQSNFAEFTLNPDRVKQGAIGWGCWTAHSDYNDKEPYQEQLIGQEKK